MSTFKKLPQHELDGMSRKDLDDYYGAMDAHQLRDKFAMAALTGLVAGDRDEWRTSEFARCAFDLADLMMIERDK